MEKQGINFLYKKLISKFRLSGNMMGDPQLLWRAALWLGFFAFIAIAAVGYLTYEWAVGAEEMHAPAKTERATLSLTELESVISLYQKKQLNFSQLLETPPQAPAYQRSGGVPVPASALPEEPENVQPETATPPSGPQG